LPKQIQTLVQESIHTATKTVRAVVHLP